MLEKTMFHAMATKCCKNWPWPVKSYAFISWIEDFTRKKVILLDHVQINNLFGPILSVSKSFTWKSHQIRRPCSYGKPWCPNYPKVRGTTFDHIPLSISPRHIHIISMSYIICILMCIYIYASPDSVMFDLPWTYVQWLKHGLWVMVIHPIMGISYEHGISLLPIKSLEVSHESLPRIKS